MTVARRHPTCSPDRSPGTRLAPSAALVVGPVLVLAALFAALFAALLAAGSRPPFADAPWGPGFDRWFGAAAPIDAVAVVTHRAALLVTAWLLVSTALHLAAALTRVPVLVRVTAWAVLPATRRAVAALVVTVGVASPTVAAHAADDGGAGATPVRDGRAVVTTVTTVTAPPVTTTAVPAAAPVTPASAASTAVPGSPSTVVVQPGDSLWSIAARVVAADQGSDPAEVPDTDVAPRWAEIVDRNAARLPSGDPSLIHPGETVEVPE